MIRKANARQEGQAMVEFALIFPLLIFIFVLIIDFGWVFMNTIIANNACRDVTRDLSINYNALKLLYAASADPIAEIEDDATDFVSSQTSTLKGIAIGISQAPSTGSPDYITVTLDVNIDILSPFVNIYGAVFDIDENGAIPYNTECTMRVEPE